MADSPIRSKQDIEAEIDAARDRLASNVAGLINEVHPKVVVQRGIDDTREFTAKQYANAKAQVIDPHTGELRTDRVLLIGGAVAGIVTFVLLVRTIAARLRGR
ncbi:MAG: DUF3618 domain-containing protein [Micropruina sp.]|nr:DUF3618 domain-containing protein [Micropruina sp.]